MPYKIEDIIEIKAALRSISHNTWLVLDLDNTVMESVLELGSDQWFTHLLHYASQLIDESESAAAMVLMIYYAVQKHVRTKAVEPEIVKIIKALQDIGVPVIGLTARGETIRQQTVHQLKAIGIDFSRQCIADFNDLTYDKGLIFCGGKNKGLALQAFINKCPIRPQHVVMLDDRHVHLTRVLDEMKRMNIQFTGLRYGFLDEKVSAFDMGAANHQLAYLKAHLPSDAQSMIDNLQLIPHDFDPVSAAVTFSGGFFHHATLLNEHPLEDQTNACTQRPRSKSFNR